MNFPSNITRDHLLKAIEKIDNEGVPKDAQSVYYDVLYNDKLYPPKVVASYANIFANGIELDRKSFEGGIDTPCFKLLQNNGFAIRQKKDNMSSSKVKIYEIKTGSAANAAKLLSPDGRYFYWNNTRFLGNEVGDLVFIINRSGNWGLFAKLGNKDIVAKQDRVAQTVTFNHEYNTFTVEDKEGVYNLFYRFDILKRRELPSGWNWTKQLGQSETFDLVKEGLQGQTDRISKIDDLEKVFTDGEASDVLQRCKEFLTSNTATNLLPEIVNAIKQEKIQKALAEGEFHNEFGRKKLDELKGFTVTQPESFYDNILNKIIGERTFEQMLSKFENDTQEREILNLIAQLVAYCDDKAWNKHSLNAYKPARTLAAAYVRMDDWVRVLLKYKRAGNRFVDNTALAIENAINYLEYPENELTMLSENHRKMVARYLLKTEYHKRTFIGAVRSFFAPYHMSPVYPLNLNNIISSVLYNSSVKKIWFETIEGLVVCDNTGWIEEARAELDDSRKIALWWDKSPTGGQETRNLLRERLEKSDEHCFYIYYTVNQIANYRSRIIDFAVEEDYNSKNWNANNDVAWYNSDFKSYSDERPGKPRRYARVVFLSDQIIKLEKPIPVKDFEFYKEYDVPTQNNMQPYSELKNFSSEPIIRTVWFVSQGLSFKKDHGTEFIWAPENDSNIPWKNVKKVKEGDIIFHYSKGIQGISVAKGPSYFFTNSYGIPANPTAGNRVDVEYYSLERSLDIDVLKKHTRTLKELLSDIDSIAFDVNGDVAQKYLTELSAKAGKYIRDVIYGRKFGVKQIDHYFDSIKLDESIPTEVPKLDFSHPFRKEICAIKTKPFLLMAGISGTGKSRMVRTLAYKTCPPELRLANEVPGNFINISVKPNWHDSTELLGYVSRITRPPKYISTEFTRFLIKALQHLDTPFFVCLDEMNLAPVEQYFAEYLSKMESRQKTAGKLVSDPLIQSETVVSYPHDIAPNVSEPLLEDLKEQGICIPPNLVVIGTVNMDESTHTFSRKVLDRAMTFEKNLSSPDGSFILTNVGVNDWRFDVDPMPSSWFRSDVLKPQEVFDDFPEKDEVAKYLNLINQKLKNCSFMVAYRTLDEVLLYVYHCSKCDNKPSDWFVRAFDEAVLMKVLPRIEGDATKCETVLSELATIFESLKLEGCKKKCEVMTTRLKSGYTSYWS